MKLFCISYDGDRDLRTDYFPEGALALTLDEGKVEVDVSAHTWTFTPAHQPRFHRHTEEFGLGSGVRVCHEIFLGPAFVGDENNPAHMSAARRFREEVATCTLTR